MTNHSQSYILFGDVIGSTLARLFSDEERVDGLAIISGENEILTSST